jgi:F0F1-type ATP synthase membrane subunit b/b'
MFKQKQESERESLKADLQESIKDLHISDLIHKILMKSYDPEKAKKLLHSRAALEDIYIGLF